MDARRVVAVRPGVPGWPVGEVRNVPAEDVPALLTEHAGRLVLAPEAYLDSAIRVAPVRRASSTDGDVSGLHLRAWGGLPWRS